MKVKAKTIIILIFIVAILVGIPFGIIEYREREAEMEQRRILTSYSRVNELLMATGNVGAPRLQNARGYVPFGLATNSWGICMKTYLLLKFHERETENIITWETLVDYFSEEFEPDGSLRLYNNGNHPEMQALVEWWAGAVGMEIVYGFREYLDRIGAIYTTYRESNENFSDIILVELSPQMLDALARAEIDPDYVLDLTSLQQAGY